MLWVYTLAMPSTSSVALGLSLLQFRHPERWGLRGRPPAGRE